LKLIILGTSGAVGRNNRDNTSLLFQFKDNFLLVDTPGSLFTKLKKINIDPFKVNNIFITHTHPDHIYGIVSFIHARMFDKSKIYIYAHSFAIKFIKKLIKLFHLNREEFPQLIYRKIRPKDIKAIQLNKDLILKPIRVKHAIDSLGIKIESQKSKIIFSSDTTKSKELIEEAKNTQILIHDCFAPSRFFEKYPKLYKMHTSSKQLGEIAKEANVKTVIPIHFSGELNFEIEEIVSEIKENFKGKIIIPEDGQVIEFTPLERKPRL
jgi:ribonuclease Z